MAFDGRNEALLLILFGLHIHIDWWDPVYPEKFFSSSGWFVCRFCVLDLSGGYTMGGVALLSLYFARVCDS